MVIHLEKEEASACNWLETYLPYQCWGLSASGVYLAVMKSQQGNILGGTLIFYLVATAWLTAGRRDGEPGIFDWGALLVVFAVASCQLTFGLEAANSQTGLKYGYPPWPYFFMGSVALLATVDDVRMLVHRGISGTQRIARHLWRMCFALFIAASSIFLARQQIFPALLRKTGVLLLLSFLPLMLMIFWLVRVRYVRAFKEKLMPRGGDGYSPDSSPSTSSSRKTPAGTAAEARMSI
jgi:hypothetical protein